MGAFELLVVRALAMDETQRRRAPADKMGRCFSVTLLEAVAPAALAAVLQRTHAQRRRRI